jgi:hypothetical protein
MVDILNYRPITEDKMSMVDSKLDEYTKYILSKQILDLEITYIRTCSLF